jgi:putative transport protein
MDRRFSQFCAALIPLLVVGSLWAFGEQPSEQTKAQPRPASEASLLAASPAVESFVASPVGRLLQQPMIALFAVLSIGLLVGQVKVKGISLGMAGVFIAGLPLGYLGYAAPREITALGIVFLLYGVGLGAGPAFFRAFGSYGKSLFAVVAAMILAGALTTILIARLTGMPPALTAGVFSGCMKNSAAFASAVDQFPQEADVVAVGYGLAYPISLIAIVLLVQLVPKLAGRDVGEMNALLEKRRPLNRKIAQVMVEVDNSAVAGKTLADLNLIGELNCRILRILEGDRLVAALPDTVCHPGLHLLVIGPEDQLPAAIEFLGHESPKRGLIDADVEPKEIVVTSRALTGTSLGDLNPQVTFGVTVEEVSRLGRDFVPNDDVVLQRMDVLQVSGSSHDLERFARVAGNRTKALQQTDMMSLSVGLVAGLILGLIPIGLPGGPTFSLGMAGGPLLVGLLLGHFGHVGRVIGHFPPATQLFLVRLGLSLLLAGASLQGGAALAPVFSEHGLTLLLMTATVTSVATGTGFLVSSLLQRRNLLETLAGLCGGMSSNPAYETLATQADSDLVLLIFTTAYAIAMILMVFAMQLLIVVLRAL